MAPKNLALARQPSKEEQEREESSDEEENSESDSGETEEEEGSSEEEDENPVSTKPQALVPKSESKLNSKSKSTLVNGSDSDSDSDAETEGSPPPDYKVEPIRKPSPPKREREEGQDLSRSSKKSKTEEKKTPASTPGGGGAISRLWSDEDEIAVLNGMIEFRKVKGNDNNIEEIYNFIKGKLQGEFNKVQLRTKITRMKKRFMNALKKSPEPVFSKPHEDMAFELSKKIWGDAVNGNGNVNNVKKEVIKNGNGNVKKETVKAEVVEEKYEAEESDFWSKYPYLSSSFLNMKGISEASVNLLKENMSSIGDSKAKELNQKWRQLFLEEAEINHKMLILIAEQTKLGLNQINDS